MKIKSTSLTTVLALVATACLAQAQAPAPDNNDPNRQRGGGDRPRSYEDFRKMMAERLKTALKVSDDEWSVIQPLVEKVTTKQRDAGGSRFGGGSSRGPGGPGGSPGGGSPPSTSSDPTRPERAGTAEREALRVALENESTSPETLKAKLAAVREIHAKATAELAAAREDLKKVLTVRQEALLVSYGILE
ncbi:MAG: hypothetical protein WCF18_19970 [Chthoniobacteraceae bacterium]